MIELKDLFQKSFLGGICFGFGWLGASFFENEVLSGLIISLGFLVALELGYPLFTERCGDARLMTTFMSYVTPDVFVLKLFSRKIVPANFLGILLVTVFGLLATTGLDSPKELVTCCWWKIFLSALVSGIILDVSSYAYRKQEKKLPVLFAVFIISYTGLNHVLSDFSQVIVNVVGGTVGIITGIKIILFSLFGNLLGSRLRTLLIKEDKR